MAGRYDRVSGTWMKNKGRFARINGAWVPVKKHFVRISGAWVPSYIRGITWTYTVSLGGAWTSAYTGPDSTYSLNGAMKYKDYTTGAQCSAIVRYAFDTPILLPTTRCISSLTNITSTYCAQYADYGYGPSINDKEITTWWGSAGTGNATDDYDYDKSNSQILASSITVRFYITFHDTDERGTVNQIYTVHTVEHGDFKLTNSGIYIPT